MQRIKSVHKDFQISQVLQFVQVICMKIQLKSKILIIASSHKLLTMYVYYTFLKMGYLIMLIQ